MATDAHVDSLTAASWRRRVAVAWMSSATPGTIARVAVSRDAGAHFDPPRDIVLAPADGPPSVSPIALRVAVTAPESQDAAPDDARIWLRVTSPVAGTVVWRSGDGGRTYQLFRGSPPGGTFDETWRTEPGDGGGVRVMPPAALRAAGPRTVEPPPDALEGPPVAVLDEHGALALAWLEQGDAVAGAHLVLRRLWVDWASAASGVRPFDSPIVVAGALTSGAPVAMVDVPGGVVVAWRGRDGGGATVEARRIGLDMTCTSEQAGAAHGPAASPSR